MGRPLFCILGVENVMEIWYSNVHATDTCVCEVKTMKEMPRYLLIDAEAVSPVYAKVLMAKRLLATHEVPNASAAARAAGISRSAFYKYKDRVFMPTLNAQQMLSYSLTLNDVPGVLSRVMYVFTSNGCNILTINQALPIDGVAPVTVTVRTDFEKGLMAKIDTELRRLPGVVKVRQIVSE